MAGSYRDVRRDQGFLLPVDMRDWLPADHLAWFVLDTVESLDVSGFERRLGGTGAPGYDPRLLLSVLIYGYCRGIRSSRQIESACRSDVAFLVLCALDAPDHSTIARFRRDHSVRTGIVRLKAVIPDGKKSFLA